MRYLSVMVVAITLIFTSFGHAQSRRTTSGNPHVDHMIGLELNLLASAFTVQPRFYFTDDWGAPNAFASVAGEVFLGLELIEKEVNEERGPLGNYSVYVVMAHEFGHIVSFIAGWHYELSGVQMEIAADFLAGWYMAKRAMHYPTDGGQGMRAVFRKGDYAFNDPSHHGTPNQRAEAYMTGSMYGHLPINSVMREAHAYAVANARGGTPMSSVSAFGCSLMRY